MVFIDDNRDMERIHELSQQNKWFGDFYSNKNENVLSSSIKYDMVCVLNLKLRLEINFNLIKT